MSYFDMGYFDGLINDIAQYRDWHKAITAIFAKEQLPLKTDIDKLYEMARGLQRYIAPQIGVEQQAEPEPRKAQDPRYDGVFHGPNRLAAFTLSRRLATGGKVGAITRDIIVKPQMDPRFDPTIATGKEARDLYQAHDAGIHRAAAFAKRVSRKRQLGLAQTPISLAYAVLACGGEVPERELSRALSAGSRPRRDGRLGGRRSFSEDEAHQRFLATLGHFGYTEADLTEAARFYGSGFGWAHPEIRGAS